MTDQQFETLSKWEDNFRTAVRSKWARNPGIAALREIHGIYSELTKTTSRLNTGCNTCVLRVLTETGKLYFAEKEARTQAQTTETARNTKKVSTPRKSKKNA